MALGPQSRQKPRPTASVFVYLSSSCHGFNIAWQAMIKTYNKVISHFCPFYIVLRLCSVIYTFRIPNVLYHWPNLHLHVLFGVGNGVYLRWMGKLFTASKYSKGHIAVLWTHWGRVRTEIHNYVTTWKHFQVIPALCVGIGNPSDTDRSRTQRSNWPIRRTCQGCLLLI